MFCFNVTGSVLMARLCNHRCIVKAMGIAYSECIFVALGIQRAMCVRRIISSSLACLTV
jgi:hypothetical protein